MAAAVDPRIKMLKGNPDTDKRLLWHHIASIMLKIAHDEVLVPVHDSPNLVPFAAGVIAEKDYYDFLWRTFKSISI